MRTFQVIGAVVATLAATAGPAVAAAAPVSCPRVVVRFDSSAGEQPENIAVEPDGAFDVTLAGAHRVVQVSTQGVARTLATLPEAPASGSGSLFDVPMATGIARARNGTLYFAYSAGNDDLTGLWRLLPGGSPHRIAALPGHGLPNGIALDERAGAIYVADSKLAAIFRVPLDGGIPTRWAAGPELASEGQDPGVNGVKLHGDALWAANSNKGTLLRIPLADPSAIETVAAGLTGIDDFAFAGASDTIIAAINPANRVVSITPGRPPVTVLTAADGLASPTAVAVEGNELFVTNGGFRPGSDATVLKARTHR